MPEQIATLIDMVTRPNMPISSVSDYIHGPSAPSYLRSELFNALPHLRDQGVPPLKLAQFAERLTNRADPAEAKRLAQTFRMLGIQDPTDIY